MEKTVNRNAGTSAGTSQLQPAIANLNRLNSAEIFSGAREVLIDHAGEEYRLRLTSHGKLILTK
jgi:hemin uptake protein HemP